MKNIWSMIFFIFYLVSSHPAYSFSVGAVDNEEIIPFTVDMLPIWTNFTSINSSSIGGFWQPSPSIEGINITELEGLLSIGVSAYSRIFLTSYCTIGHLDMLNQTDEGTCNRLPSDTVLQVCFQSQWHAPHTTINGCFKPDGLYRRKCQLVRTYTENDTTLNPVPVFGEYTWVQIMTSANTLGIVVNASVSSELPYMKLNITVTLGSEEQSQVFNMPLESANFTFDGLDLEPKDYPLSITFTSIDTDGDDLFAATNTLNGTVRTIAPTPTPAPGMGNKPFACHFLFLVFLTTFVSLWYNESI